jgi:hypothetical protein
MTYNDVRKLALAWPEVENGTSYGTPALQGLSDGADPAVEDEARHRRAAAAPAMAGAGVEEGGSVNGIVGWAKRKACPPFNARRLLS